MLDTQLFRLFLLQSGAAATVDAPSVWPLKCVAVLCLWSGYRTDPPALGRRKFPLLRGLIFVCPPEADHEQDDPAPPQPMEVLYREPPEADLPMPPPPPPARQPARHPNQGTGTT